MLGNVPQETRDVHRPRQYAPPLRESQPSVVRHAELWEGWANLDDNASDDWEEEDIQQQAQAGSQLDEAVYFDF